MPLPAPPLDETLILYCYDCARGVLTCMHVLAAAIIQEQLLFLSTHLEVRLLFESGCQSRAASDRAHTVDIYHPENS